MKKKIILLASFAIIAGSGILYAFNSNPKTNAACTGDCCKKQSCCTSTSCETPCSCGDECSGSGCDCGCSCCE